MSCQHVNVQQFTERCLDCGANIYESEDERYHRLKSEIDMMRCELNKRNNDELEAERDKLKELLNPQPDPQTNW